MMQGVIPNALVPQLRDGFAAQYLAPFGESFCHRSELSTASLRPDWHFQEKPIPLKARNSRVASRVPDYFLTLLTTAA